MAALRMCSKKVVNFKVTQTHWNGETMIRFVSEKMPKLSARFNAWQPLCQRVFRTLLLEVLDKQSEGCLRTGNELPEFLVR